MTRYNNWSNSFQFLGSFFTIAKIPIQFLRLLATQSGIPLSHQFLLPSLFTLTREFIIHKANQNLPMKRRDHHCPGKGGNVGSGATLIPAGGCRIITKPVRHCEKHQNYCIPHYTAFMKNTQACPSCLGESK